jgi:ribosomal protein S27AE
MMTYQTYPDEIPRKSIRFCNHCGAKRVEPVIYSAVKGSKTQMVYMCPKCGETIVAYWR